MNKAAATGAAIGDEAAEHTSGGEILTADAVSAAPGVGGAARPCGNLLVAPLGASTASGGRAEGREAGQTWPTSTKIWPRQRWGGGDFFSPPPCGPEQKLNHRFLSAAPRLRVLKAAFLQRQTQSCSSRATSARPFTISKTPLPR